MAGTVPKPGYIFDRVAEWQALAEFATGDRLGATLGVVSGRRRQGKTLLLESMCEELGGLYSTVPEDMPASEHLRSLAEALGAFTGGLPPRLDSWDQAIEALFGFGAAGRPVPVVLDEFPYMARSASGLPSIIQHALSPRGKARTGSRTRLILCGSSISFMGQLVSGSAALFGRARLSLMVRAFDSGRPLGSGGSRTTCRWRRRCSRWWAGLPLTSSTRLGCPRRWASLTSG